MGIEELVANESQPVDERIKLLLKENTRLRGKLAKRESGVEIITGVLQDVYKKPSDLKVLKPRKSKKSQAETALLHLTDIHYGKLTSTFDTSTCVDRMIQLSEAVEEIVALRRSSAAINKIVVLLGGDMVEGQNIFPGQAFSLDADIVQQCLKDGPEVVANTIIHMASIFPEVEVQAVPGNHGRVDKNGSGQFNTDSIFYEVVRGLVSKVAKNVTWNLPLDREPGKQWFAYTQIEGRGVVLIHGDFRGGPTNTLGYPWYAIGRRVAHWSSVFPSFEFVFVGHNHVWAGFETAGKMVLATGSIESNNDYAAKNFASEGQPHQRLCFFNDSYGIISDIRIHLE